MSKIYENWINESVGDPLGKCKEVTEQMSQIFPELRRVRGYYICPAWGDREHWWLITSDGEIVDPTKHQFPSKGTGLYQELDERKREPKGRCYNCGEYVYNYDRFCGEKCSREATPCLY